ncbi:odorant receptor 82a-like [Odontomachus brunneus]|uniref:odorant receptor 82a-like n=1 Tax=Odontomachus brunneus TaxID=486640 RepID=UPI0013F2A474|nr:odorant receptor 82a-like [Odontomachus brunneus]
MTHPKRVSKDDNFENVNNYSLQINRWFLEPIGAWPQMNTLSTIKRITVLIQIFICSMIVAINAVPCMLYVSLEKESFKSKLNVLCPLLHRITGTINYCVLLQRSKDIQDCIRHMEMDWQIVQRINDREVMLQHAKVGRFISGICAAFMQGGAILFALGKAIKTTTFMISNETYTMHPLTCPAYSKIIDTRFSPINEIMLTVQVISAFVASSSTVGICGFAAVFAMHACSQLNVLYTWLNELVDDQDKEPCSVNKKLAIVVEHHLRILSFIARMESIMHKACFAQMMGSTINMCLCGYYIIMNWGSGEFHLTKIISYIISYLSMCFNIFIFCYIGEVLTEQCKHVGEMTYMTNWYKLPHKTALCLILIIARSSSLIKITAGKLFHLSIATFGDVMKTSIVYLNFLRTMTT